MILHYQCTSSNPPQPPVIFRVPVELNQHILSFCHPWDAASFSKCCRASYALVYNPTDQHLWRQLFLANFDPPHIIDDARRNVGLTSRTTPLDWKSNLTTRMKAELTLFRGPASLVDRRGALEVIVAIIEDSSLAMLSNTTGPHRNLEWLRRVFQQSLILHNLFSVSDDHDVQLSAKLRAYCALLIDKKIDNKTFSKMLGKRDKSRAYVYDLRHYNAENLWGPFLPDGLVNWIHIEHLVNVVSSNIRELPGIWCLTRPPTCLDTRRPFSTVTSSMKSNDWAGVEGTWRRYVCSMDYRDLYAFNFTDLADGPRHPRFFKDPRFREATRLLEMKLHIIPAQQMRFHRSVDLRTNKSSTHAPLCFTGVSKGVNGNEATLEGLVTMGKDGTARWRFIIIYADHPQWSGNGVQIGGIGNAMGVVGIWTTIHHDQDDPFGPFWLWKVEDNSPTHLMDYI
ncbi:hypothetical protein B0H34DRAFT_683143 [Crassisporium funariophilum]|nr:hypothetical protein B0H34DRAFT_683143 [Crassisporium funariophilum]